MATVKFRALIFSLISLFATTLSACAQKSEGDPDENHTRRVESSAAATALESALRQTSESKIQAGIQDALAVSKYPPEAKIFETLRDVWEGRESLHPAFNWTLLNTPEIRLTIASELVQAERNQLISVSLEEFRSFALDQIHKHPSALTGRAIVLLGQVGLRSDIPVLMQLGTDGSEGYVFFHEAVLAIKHICGEEADKALASLRDHASGRDRTFAEETINVRPQIVQLWCHKE